MITIQVVRSETPDGELISPASAFPTNAIAIQCDGDTYTVYQPGDEVPAVDAG